MTKLTFQFGKTRKSPEPPVHKHPQRNKKMPSVSSIVGSTVAAGAIFYLAYFDYQRRHSPEFRAQIRRRNNAQARKEEKAVEEGRSRQRSAIVGLIEASLRESPLPADIATRERFFIEEVGRADELLNGGPDSYLDAALAFYRALMVYPSPEDLLGVYEKSIRAPEVLDVLRTMVVIRPPAALAAAVQESLGQNLGVE